MPVVRIMIQRTPRPEQRERPEPPERYRRQEEYEQRPEAYERRPEEYEEYEEYERSEPYERYGRPRQYQPRPRRPWPHRLRPHVPRWLKWTAILLVAGLIFRRAVAWLLLTALSAGLHLFGVNVHLPHISFGWPWQSIAAGTTTNIVVGPIVLQKIEGISRPALGTENFNFVFTRTVNKSVLFWPCWYSASFYAVGRASATVDLNPGPAWWKPSTGHYQLRVLRRAAPGSTGQLAISMALPDPQLPQSVHDISVDNTLSQPVSASHSWTYPGVGCGLLIRPQFAQSVLYAQAQSIAFYQATHLASVTGPLIGAAENEATEMIRDNFVQPTVNALGYTLTRFSIRWVAPTLALPHL
jgi:hypothetical protein